MAPTKISAATASAAPKKGSPSKSTATPAPAAVAATPVKKTAAAPAKAVAAADKKSNENRRNRHMFDRVTHQVFTPFFAGMEEHLINSLPSSTPEQIHAAILSYDVKSFFQKQYETKGRRAAKKKPEGKRLLSTFMLFQEDMRPKVTEKLERDNGGKRPSQPEVVRQLGKMWNQMKKQPGGIDHYKQLYEENKRKKAEAAAAATDEFDA